jgi:hypothetical protein
MHTPTLATRFARNTFRCRSETPLLEDQMRKAAPSIFATAKHAQPLRALYLHTDDRGPARPPKEGFEPFMVAQSKSRIEGKTEFTKHMIRMRHAGKCRPSRRRTRSSSSTATTGRAHIKCWPVSSAYGQQDIGGTMSRAELCPVRVTTTTEQLSNSGT